MGRNSPLSFGNQWVPLAPDFSLRGVQIGLGIAMQNVAPVCILSQDSLLTTLETGSEGSRVHFGRHRVLDFRPLHLGHALESLLGETTTLNVRIQSHVVQPFELVEGSSVIRTSLCFRVHVGLTLCSVRVAWLRREGRHERPFSLTVNPKFVSSLTPSLEISVNCVRINQSSFIQGCHLGKARTLVWDSATENLRS